MGKCSTLSVAANEKVVRPSAECCGSRTTQTQSSEQLAVGERGVTRLGRLLCEISRVLVESEHWKL